jgi:Ca-activated chloride channel family protein
MSTTQNTTRAILLLVSTSFATALWAGEAEREQAVQINSANSLLRSGNVKGAIAAYQQAQETGGQRSDLSYNLAVAQYRKGDVQSAERLFQSTAATENDSLAAKSRYNLGNCKFASALRDAEKDRQTAIKGLEAAIANYRSALDIDPNDADARANIERAAALIEKLRNEDRKDQQKQQQQNGQQQKQNEKQDSSQQSDSQQSKSQQNDQQQNDQNDKQQSQDKQQQDKQQKSESSSKTDDSKSAQKPQSDSKDQSKNENSSQEKSQQQKQNSQAQKDQQQGSKTQDKSQPEKSDSHSQSAANPKQQNAKLVQPQPQHDKQQRSPKQENDNSIPSSPEQPNDQQGKTPPKGSLSAAGKADDQNDKEKEDVAALDQAKDGEMTLQEAQKMLQSIRDRDMLRRMQRQAAERDRHVPVDRDW